MKVMILGGCGISRALMLSLAGSNNPPVLFARDDIDIHSPEALEAIKVEACEYSDLHCNDSLESIYGRDCRFPQLPEKQTYTPPVNRKSKRW